MAIMRLKDAEETSSEQVILVTGNVAKILIDSNDKYTIATGDGLELKEGYVLNVQQVSIDDNKVLLELTKDGYVVDTKVVNPSIDDVYVYDGESPDDKDKYPLIIARIDVIFRGTDTNLVTIRGIFQASDTITSIKTCSKYGELDGKIMNEMLQTKYGKT